MVDAKKKVPSFGIAPSICKVIHTIKVSNPFSPNTDHDRQVTEHFFGLIMKLQATATSYR